LFLNFRNVIFEKQKVKKGNFFFSVTPVLKNLYIEKDIFNYMSTDKVTDAFAENKARRKFISKVIILFIFPSLFS
jgi:hypothetical protein